METEFVFYGPTKSIGALPKTICVYIIIYMFKNLNIELITDPLNGVRTMVMRC